MKSIDRTISVVLLSLILLACREPSIRPVVFPQSNDDVEGAALSQKALDATDEEVARVKVFHRAGKEPKDLVMTPGKTQWWNDELYEFRGTIEATFVSGHSPLLLVGGGSYIPDDCYRADVGAVSDRQEGYIRALKRGGYALRADFVVVVDGIRAGNCWRKNVGHGFRRRQVRDDELPPSSSSR